MKRLVIGVVLAAGLTAAAFASFNSNKKKSPEKKVEKKECRHTCPFS